MNWFDPSDDVVIQPGVDRTRFWKQKYGIDKIEVAQQVLFVNNGLGKLFDAVCKELDHRATAVYDYRTQGYVHYKGQSQRFLTLYQAPTPAPWAAADLEFLISAGAQQIIFVNGAGSLQENIDVGSIILPGELIREEGTSFHYVPPDILLQTDEVLNQHIQNIANSLNVKLAHGKHWTTDAIYRETFTKIKQLKSSGVLSVDMELSALAGVARYRKCALSALLMVTDILSKSHTWSGIASQQFQQGVKQAAQIAARLFPY